MRWCSRTNRPCCVCIPISASSPPAALHATLSLCNSPPGRRGRSGSWQPRNGAGSVVVTVDARIGDQNLAGTTNTSIGLQGAKTLPVLSSGPLSGGSLTEGPLSPGELVLIKGTGLANGQASASGS